MKTSERLELIRRARRCGIQPHFTDSSGRRQEVSAAALLALVEQLDEPDRAPELLPPVIVCWAGSAKSVRVRVGSPAARRFFPPSTLLPLVPRTSPRPFPGGQGESPPGQISKSFAGNASFERSSDSWGVLRLPALPFGYYDLGLETEGGRQRTLIISAPVKAFAKNGLRRWGVFAPMYALSSEDSWGAGTLSDWRELCEWLANLNGSRAGPIGEGSASIVTATLPLLGAFLDEFKCEPSPYSPATRLFWNEFYLDVTRVPEFSASKVAQRLVQSPGFRRDLDALRQSSLVEYGAGMDLKRRVIEQLALEFFSHGTRRRDQFEEFVTQRPEVERYAQFRAVCQTRREAWHSWPQRLREGKLRPSDFEESHRRYHLFAQWLVQKQMGDVLARCRELGVSFYLDLPLGTHPDGYDVWAHQHLFMNGMSAGAPPDVFFTKGQSWGFPPLHPQRMREDGYRYVIDYLRFQMQHTGLLRLDHVMGLHRLWWVPPGSSAADGAYVTYPAEELYAVLSLESHLHQTTLVGENLGTVPPIVNRSMERHGIRSMYVAQYETRPKARTSLPNPPAGCAASLNTHDMPTWAAFWEGMDISDREKLKLLTPEQARKEKQGRRRLRSALGAFFRRRHLLAGRNDAASVLEALIRFLGRSDADLVLVNLEDLWLETEPQNTPGTSTERINWRRKMRKSLKQIRSDPTVGRLVRELQKSRSKVR